MTIEKSRIDSLKIAAHPLRIAILDELSKGVKCVSDLEEFLEVSQPNISQHLAALRHADIIDFFIDGRLRCYFIKKPFVLSLLQILKKEYSEDLEGPECCPTTKRGTYPGKRRK